MRRGQSYAWALHLITPMYRVDVFQFLFVDKGIIAERDYQVYGREDFADKYFAGDIIILVP